MPLLLERIDRNVVSTPPDTPVRDVLERARRKPARIYTWVVAPLPGGGYAVTRMNEIALLAEELGAAILDSTLEELPGLLRAGGAVQDSADLNTAEVQALTNPAKRIPVLDGEDVLGVLNLGPQRPPLPELDPWRLEGISPYQWPYDTLLLYAELVILDPSDDADELLWWLEQAESDWIYLVVPQRGSSYQVLAVDAALRDALREHRRRYHPLLIGDLPLPAPVPAVAEGAIPWEVVRERVLDTPARCLPVTRGGRVIGVLAEPARRVPTRRQWLRALSGEPAPWSAGHEQTVSPPSEPEVIPPTQTDDPDSIVGGGSFIGGAFGHVPVPKPYPDPWDEAETGSRPRRGARRGTGSRPRRGEQTEPETGSRPRRGTRRGTGSRPRRGARAEPETTAGAEPEPVPVPKGGLESEPVRPPSRFLNTGFFAQDKTTFQPTDQPLALDGGLYCLGVNVGAFWGIGEKPEEIYAIDGIVKEQLEELEEGEELDLLLTVRPRAVKENLVKVDNPRAQLQLPKTVDGPKVFFGLAFENPGLHALNVDLWYQGHLLQSQRVEFWVVEHAGDAVPAEQLPQDRRLTYSRAGTLSKESLAALEKRPSTLTILVDRDEQIDLWFYDVNGNAIGTEQSHLSDAVLKDLLQRMRTALEEAGKPYQGQIGGDREMLRLSLWQLADVGNEFYRALLPKVFDPGAPGSQGDLQKLPLNHGQVIQVAALSMLPGVPWELLYQRPIESFDEGSPDLVRLCPDFDTHSPQACPHDDSEVVCPHNFWGYRYIIEQLPNWVEPKQPPPLADLPLVIRNQRPLRFVPVVFGWPNLDTHLEELRALAKAEDMDLEPRIMTKAALKAELVDQLEPADILYFYVHGGFDAQGPMVELGPLQAKARFRASDLAAWKDKIDLSLRQPLVVFNACETAAFLPEHHESLPKGFADRGASGVIGTQVKVFESFAACFIRLFFRKFLAQKTVGQSLFEARRELLFNVVQDSDKSELRPDPRGLVYSLFSAADVELAQPAIKPE